MSKSTVVVFLLPGSGHVPVGGFRVVYQYAQGLSARGYRTRVIHTAVSREDLPAARRVKAFLGYLRRRWTGYTPSSWFSFVTPVELLWVRSLNPRMLDGADCVVATSWETAEWLAALGSLKGCERWYLIQHYESWSGEEDRVRRTWTLPLRKVVIARWLQEIARSLGEEAIYIPNGLDLETFRLDVAIEERSPDHVAMLFHQAAWKGTAIGIEALRLVKERFPGLRAALFGTPRPPGDLPNFATYLRNPAQGSLRDLYNAAAIVISPSLSEGWGLTGTEGMACGAAFAGTDIGGHREFARPEETAILCEPGDPRSLAAAVGRLIEDRDLRIGIARRGHEEVQRYTWEVAVGRFETAIRSTRSGSRS